MLAPDFSLLDQEGALRNLHDYRGSWVILYFYPKDDTPGCTKEACSFRDSYAVFQEKGVTVLGVSADSVKSHAKFAKKYNLHFSLLSDPEKTTISAYGAWGLKKMMGREFEGIIRQTYIINPQGDIAKQYAEVTPEHHAAEILQDLAILGMK